MTYLSIVAFGALGVSLRFGADILVRIISFPLATFVVNLVGCFLAGYFFSLEDSPLRNGLLIGLCGGLTTFSALILQSLVMIRNGEWVKAVAYLMISQLAGLILAWWGMKLR